MGEGEIVGYSKEEEARYLFFQLIESDCKLYGFARRHVVTENVCRESSGFDKQNTLRNTFMLVRDLFMKIGGKSRKKPDCVSNTGYVTARQLISKWSSVPDHSFPVSLTPLLSFFFFFLILSPSNTRFFSNPERPLIFTWSTHLCCLHNKERDRYHKWWKWAQMIETI